MADPKKISPQAGKKELERWLQEQLNAPGSDMAQGDDGPPNKDDPFYKDAMEGLGKFSSTREIYNHTNRINRSIQKKTGAGRKKGPVDTGHLFWFVVAIVVIIMVIILAFVVIRMRLGQI
ncbi:hypothetical protein [Arachidicoccus terrestris]|uniref:hypothetical protein n=1 Tax=Arachidicoccus terrestris TaxID=2875539 RepID=UPI001CC391AB|nr:hypothetical protein [Arachidicoccus terrestris]UAY54675.1 hypothetical protein K9M52_14660 [Arachidicoccus terrestris]